MGGARWGREAWAFFDADGQGLAATADERASDYGIKDRVAKASPDADRAIVDVCAGRAQVGAGRAALNEAAVLRLLSGSARTRASRERHRFTRRAQRRE